MLRNLMRGKFHFAFSSRLFVSVYCSFRLPFFFPCWDVCWRRFFRSVLSSFSHSIFFFSHMRSFAQFLLLYRHLFCSKTIQNNTKLFHFIILSRPRVQSIYVCKHGIEKRVYVYIAMPLNKSKRKHKFSALCICKCVQVFLRLCSYAQQH